jgi:hypothetical protein
MDAFGGFHDGCLREMHVWTGYSVGRNLSMDVPHEYELSARVLIQRQFESPSAIEMLFEQVVRINVVPPPENYDAIIYGATLLLRDGTFYWSPEEEWSPENVAASQTFLASNRVSWRDASDWMGSTLRYGPGTDTEPS